MLKGIWESKALWVYKSLKATLCDVKAPGVAEGKKFVCQISLACMEQGKNNVKTLHLLLKPVSQNLFKANLHFIFVFTISYLIFSSHILSF